MKKTSLEIRKEGKVKVCLGCNKLYEKCYCRRPHTYYLSLYDIDQILNPRAISSL